MGLGERRILHIEWSSEVAGRPRDPKAGHKPSVPGASSRDSCEGSEWTFQAHDTTENSQYSHTAYKLPFHLFSTFYSSLFIITKYTMLKEYFSISHSPRNSAKYLKIFHEYNFLRNIYENRVI